MVKILPKFVDQLDPPLLAISDSRTCEKLFFRESKFAPKDALHLEDQPWFITDEVLDQANQNVTMVAMEDNVNLAEYKYDAREKLGKEFHITMSCIPMHVTIDKCHDDGYMFVVVGQETYDYSPFVHNIDQILTDDVDAYYGYILIIFFSGNACNFMILWTWLRVHVTERLFQLQIKITAGSDKSENRNLITRARGVDQFDSGSPKFAKRNSLDTDTKGVLYKGHEKTKWEVRSSLRSDSQLSSTAAITEEPLFTNGEHHHRMSGASAAERRLQM